MAQIIAMAKKLQEYEHIIEDLQKVGSSSTGLRSISNAHEEWGSLVHNSASDHGLEIDHNLTRKTYTNTSSETNNVTKISTSEALSSDLSLDENGKVRHVYATVAGNYNNNIAVMLSWANFRST